MKNIKYSISACCLILSFILLVSIAYSASSDTDNPAISPVKPPKMPQASQPNTPSTSIPQTLQLKIPSVPIIQITSPIANENVLIGSKCKIQWTKIGQMSQFVNILLVQGQASKVILSNVPNNGYYEWLTPDIYGTGKFSFRIITVDNMIQADSNVFNIAKVANPNEKDIICPNKIAIDNITTQPANTAEFIGMGLANVPVTFNLYGTGKDSNTVCYCEYYIGELRAKMKANMVGYTSCTVGYVSVPNTGTQVKGITLFK
jgi:hypothetical protein